MSLPGLEPAELPADAVEVGRILDAWGVKGWFKIQPFSASPEALFSSKRWFIQPSERPGKVSFSGTVCLSIKQARDHADTVVASAHEIPDRHAAEQLKGARIFVSRASFPTPEEGEYYWVDLIGCEVVTPSGQPLGKVEAVGDHGAHPLLRLQGADGRERLIPFVEAHVPEVDVKARRIVADWDPEF